MKKIIFLLISLHAVSCVQAPSEVCKDLESKQVKLEAAINMYSTVWNKVFETRDVSHIDEASFDTQVIVVTSSGNITGIQGFKDYYAGYFSGFSDLEVEIVEVVAQGDRLVKHWSLQGTHDGDLFGIPATNKRVEISGLTWVTLKDGKIVQEQDFFDNYSFLSQLGLIEQ